MAVVTLSLPDEVYQQYVNMGGASPNKQMVQQLTRFAEFAPQDRVLILSKAEQKEIEGLYGKPVDHKEWPDFFAWMKARASVKIGATEIPLNQAQLKRLASQVYFWKRTHQTEEEAERQFLQQKLGGALSAILGS
jgi:hypothetical protein